MRAQIQNRIKKLEEEFAAKDATIRTANQKYLELNHAHGVLINAAVPKLRSTRMRLYISVGVNILFFAIIITTILTR